MYKESKCCCTADGFLVLKGFCKLIEAQATANIRRDLEKLLIPWSGQWIGLRLIQPSQNFEKSFLIHSKLAKINSSPIEHKALISVRLLQGEVIIWSAVKCGGAAVQCDVWGGTRKLPRPRQRGRGCLELQLLMDITSSYGETSSQHGIFRCKPRE